MNLPERWPLAGIGNLQFTVDVISKEAGEDAGDPADYLIARIFSLTAKESILQTTKALVWFRGVNAPPLVRGEF